MHKLLKYLDGSAIEKISEDPTYLNWVPPFGEIVRSHVISGDSEKTLVETIFLSPIQTGPYGYNFLFFNQSDEYFKEIFGGSANRGDDFLSNKVGYHRDISLWIDSRTDKGFVNMRKFPFGSYVPELIWGEGIFYNEQEVIMDNFREIGTARDFNIIESRLSNKVMKLDELIRSVSPEKSGEFASESQDLNHMRSLAQRFFLNFKRELDATNIEYRK